MKKSKKKELHKVMAIHAWEAPHFIEAGIVKNPTHKDCIYFMINGKWTSGLFELRKSEVLVLIMVLSAALNKKITGIEFSKMKGGEKNE